jgi:hypothetical protein
MLISLYPQNVTRSVLNSFPTFSEANVIRGRLMHEYVANLFQYRMKGSVRQKMRGI